MNSVESILIGILILILGIPLGNFLKRQTEDEIKQGQFWFKIVILLSFIGAILSLVFQNDAFLFTFAFIAIVTSRSLKK